MSNTYTRWVLAGEQGAIAYFRTRLEALEMAASLSREFTVNVYMQVIQETDSYAI